MVWLSGTILDRSRVNTWERIQSDPKVDRSQIYPVPCKQGLKLSSKEGKKTLVGHIPVELLSLVDYFFEDRRVIVEVTGKEEARGRTCCCCQVHSKYDE